MRILLAVVVGSVAIFAVAWFSVKAALLILAALFICSIVAATWDIISSNRGNLKRLLFPALVGWQTLYLSYRFHASLIDCLWLFAPLFVVIGVPRFLDRLRRPEATSDLPSEAEVTEMKRVPLPSAIRSSADYGALKP
jgi:hypothetical protein